MTFLDAHCHLQDPRVDLVRKDWIAAAKKKSITEFMLAGVSPEDWSRQEKLVHAFPETKFHLSAGLHPWWVSGRSETEIEGDLGTLEKLLEDDSEGTKWVGLGETGLDHQDRFSESMRHLQAKAFRAQLNLAESHERPLVLHVVRAHQEALQTLEDHSGKGGLVHSFSADPAIAKAYLKKGFLLSVSAAVISRGKGKAFRNLRETVLEIGLSDLCLETDAPDQPPADLPKVDGKPPFNSVENLWRVAEGIAEWKKCRPEDVLEAATENWKKKFIRA